MENFAVYWDGDLGRELLDGNKLVKYSIKSGTERIYYDRKRDWNKIVERAMSKDFSWKNSAGQYQELYKSLIGE